MNKAQKQAQQAELNAEKQLIKELTAVYRKARQDCETKISELSSRSDMENLQSVVYQQKYQEAIKKQIDEALKGLQTGQYDKIHNFTTDSYNNGYIGAMYDIQQQGIPMTVPIDQRKVEKALRTDSKLSKGLYTRLGEDYNLLKTRIRTNLSRGVVQGQSWNDIAKNIAGGMNSPFKTAFNSAVRIARTEGHRVQQSASYDAMNVAKEKGADVLKQWDSTLDDKTRDTHRMLDGQIRELDEPFEVEGMKAMFPSDFGIASEDINCRCCVLQRARWALDEDELETLKERAEYFGLDKSEDFEDYKEKYLKLPENADIMKVPPSVEFFHDVSGTTTKIKGTMSDAEYQEFLKMIQSNPDIAGLYDIADDIGRVTFKKGSGCFYGRSLEYGFPDSSHIKEGMNKYSTLTHEYGHFFDTRSYDGLTFTEYDGLRRAMGRQPIKNVASSSDQFLSAMRKDAKYIAGHYQEVKDYCIDHLHTSIGVQDAVDGLGLGRIWWGHGDKYYNRFYNRSIKGGSRGTDHSKDVKGFYAGLGFDVSNQAKVKKLSRHYETSSELWANIASAVACGGEELESAKKYFPEATKAFLEITGKLVK